MNVQVLLLNSSLSGYILSLIFVVQTTYIQDFYNRNYTFFCCIDNPISSDFCLATAFRAQSYLVHDSLTIGGVGRVLPKRALYHD